MLSPPLTTPSAGVGEGDITSAVREKFAEEEEHEQESEETQEVEAEQREVQWALRPAVGLVAWSVWNLGAEWGPHPSNPAVSR